MGATAAPLSGQMTQLRADALAWREETGPVIVTPPPPALIDLRDRDHPARTLVVHFLLDFGYLIPTQLDPHGQPTDEMLATALQVF